MLYKKIVVDSTTDNQKSLKRNLDSFIEYLIDLIDEYELLPGYEKSKSKGVKNNDPNNKIKQQDNKEDKRI